MNTCRHCGRKGRFYRREPHGYVNWFEWAEKMGRTHHQERCPGCGRLSVWKRGDARGDARGEAARLTPRDALVAWKRGADEGAPSA